MHAPGHLLKCLTAEEFCPIPVLFLGLTIVKAISVMHGGSVFARAGEGHVWVGLSIGQAATRG